MAHNVFPEAIGRRSPSERAAAIPSWIVSVLLHATLLLFLATQMKSCGGGVPGGSEGEFREVGIYVRSDDENRTEQPPTEPESPPETVENPTHTDADPISQAMNRPPSETSPPADLVQLPASPQPLIGGGPAVAAPPPGLLDTPTNRSTNTVRSRPGSAAAGTPFPVGHGQTPFFGIRDTGTRFVYVVDKSGSMSSHGAIRAAKAELLASLVSLDATQQFQIVFYANSPIVMPSGRGGYELMWATDINRTLARQFIAGIQPDGGTDHIPALQRALKLNPDVIFFLTDAEEPQLTAGELERVRKLNGSRARIHCIEFGTGPKLNTGVENFLQKLARQNGGSYRYQDVTQFGRR